VGDGEADAQQLPIASTDKASAGGDEEKAAAAPASYQADSIPYGDQSAGQQLLFTDMQHIGPPMPMYPAAPAFAGSQNDMYESMMRLRDENMQLRQENQRLLDELRILREVTEQQMSQAAGLRLQ
jgi:hypothetical protein